MRPFLGTTRRVALCVALVLTGCSSTTPYVGQGSHPQITRGRPIPLVDGIGNALGIFSRIMLLNGKVDNHRVSALTESFLVRYIDLPQSKTDGTQFSLNEYAPGRAFKRLIHNKKVA